MSRYDFPSERGEDFHLTGTITKGGVGYPTNVAGFTATFRAKRARSDLDANAIVTKAVTLTNGGAWDAHIASADTAAFTRDELLDYGVFLLEPDGTETRVAYGTWKVGVS